MPHATTMSQILSLRDVNLINYRQDRDRPTGLKV